MAITKLSLERALGYAKQSGYTGPDDNATEIKKHLAQFDLKIDGEAVDTDNLEIEAPAKVEKKSVTITSEKKAEEPAPRAIDPNVIKNAVADEIAKFGTKFDALEKSIGALKRPQILEVGGGVSVERKRYEEKIKSGRASFTSFDEADLMGDMILAKLFGEIPEHRDNERVVNAKKALQGRIERKDLTIKPGSGGITLGENFSPSVFRLFNQYGVVRQNATVVDNIQGTYDYFKSDPTAIRAKYDGSTTSQEATYSAVKLTPSEGRIITKISRNLLQSSKLDMADQVMQDHAWAWGYESDLCAVSGDATAQYGHINGILNSFTTDGLTLATAAGAVNANPAGTTAGSWTDYTISHFQAVQGKLPRWARQQMGGEVKWYFSNAFYYTVVMPLAVGTSRALASEVLTIDAEGVMRFLGSPVVLWEVMNSTASTGASTVDALYGNLRASFLYGTGVGGLEMNLSDQRYWDENAIGVRSVMKHDANFHARGTTSVPGGLIALYQI